MTETLKIKKKTINYKFISKDTTAISRHILLLNDVPPVF